MSIEETAEAAEFFGSDGVIVTGTATGQPARVEDLQGTVNESVIQSEMVFHDLLPPLRKSEDFYTSRIFYVQNVCGLCEKHFLQIQVVCLSKNKFVQTVVSTIKDEIFPLISGFPLF